MIYAIRDNNAGRVLVEFASMKQLEAKQAESFARQKPPFKTTYRPVRSWEAREWVKAGGIHETGLFVEDGKVRYAEAEA